MTIPPPPGMRSPGAESSALPGPGGFSSGNAISGNSSEPRNASPIPVIAGFLVLTASVVIKYLTSTNALLESDIREFWMNFAGYLLTPFFMVLVLAWDLIAQRKGMRDINFFPRRKYSSILRALTLVSFLIALLHIIPMSYFLAEMWASR